MASVHVWTVAEFGDEIAKQAVEDVRPHPDPWEEQVYSLLRKVHDRGDGVAIYVNQDLGHPSLGTWQVVSYGGPQAQLEVEPEDGSGSLSMPPTTLPDIGGAINWRYQLHAIVPSEQQKGAAGYA